MGARSVDPLVIVGQGLAGSCLGWQLEKRGVPFRIVDAGQEHAASRVGAGLMNPLTGRRLVPTWKFAEWREDALVSYREMANVLGQPLVVPIPIQRRFRDRLERERFQDRLRDPAVAAWVEASDADGLWLRGGAYVETGTLLRAFRERWQARGWYEQRSVTNAELAGDTVIWCTGAQPPPEFAFVPWEISKGEVLRGTLKEREQAGLIVDGHWLLRRHDGGVVVGATYERSNLRLEPSTSARTKLMEVARRLGAVSFELDRHEVGLRVTTPDRRPVLGWHPHESGRGIFAGLGSKGALWAPVLAQRWTALLLQGERLENVLDVTRFAPNIGER